jgi:hypothetical protein
MRVVVKDVRYYGAWAVCEELASWTASFFPYTERTYIEVQRSRSRYRGTGGTFYRENPSRKVVDVPHKITVEMTPLEPVLGFPYEGSVLWTVERGLILSWQEDFVSALAHEFRHLQVHYWPYAKVPRQQEVDCEQAARRVLEAYRQGPGKERVEWSERVWDIRRKQENPTLYEWCTPELNELETEASYTPMEKSA